MEEEFATGGENPGTTIGPDAEGEKKPEQKAAEDPNKEALSALTAAVTSLKDDLAYLKAENDLLKANILEQGAPKPEEKAAPDKESMKEKLAEDPVGAIEDLIESKVSSAKAETQETIRLSELKREDQTKTVTEFGEYLEDPEFQRLAETAYKEIVGREEWKPNSLYLAASVAFTKLSKKGGLKKKEKVPESSGVGTSSETGAAPAGESGGVKFSNEELQAIDKVCKRWGIPREKYMESFNNARKRDPSFGKIG